MAVVETKTDGNVAIITINRPEALNAINLDVMHGLVEAAQEYDADENIGCMVITGEGKAFIAGADIKQLQNKDYMEMFLEDLSAGWDGLTAVRTPMIAAVNGFALGGGCEVAMMCDMIFASTKAKFGQPEIKLGVIPGFGGTQRLPLAIGKSKAMDLTLTGRMMDAQEAERCGLVARIYEPEELLSESIKTAQEIASMSRPSTLLAKEAVNVAYETSLKEGVRFERRVFYSLFSTHDQKEGMAAFSEKRAPNFKNR